MRTEHFQWEGPRATAGRVRLWALEAWPEVDIDSLYAEFLERDDEDAMLLELTARFDATEVTPEQLRVDPGKIGEALSKIEPRLRESLEVAAANIQAVARAQVVDVAQEVTLPQGQSVTIREVPVGAAGIYAPGGRAAYPSSVLMCAIPARVAGVERLALATPPGPDGEVNPVVLAAAALCSVDEVYAVGGAQAIFGLAYGTGSIESVDVVAGPGNAWVREAKRKVSGVVAIDSLAGPSELMVLIDESTNLQWAALDLCAQAEHGEETALVVVAADTELLQAIELETKRAAASRSGVADAPLALVYAPDRAAAMEMANAFAPEHLELPVLDSRSLARTATTAGCVFAGPYSATAFGDYAAGSNHVLPTSRAGFYSGPLGPGTFRRKISTVEVPPDAAAKLAPHVDAIARAEGFAVHGESAMIRAEENA